MRSGNGRLSIFIPAKPGFRRSTSAATARASSRRPSCDRHAASRARLLRPAFALAANASSYHRV